MKGCEVKQEMNAISRASRKWDSLNLLGSSGLLLEQAREGLRIQLVVKQDDDGLNCVVLHSCVLMITLII